jgi:hypothetical protein
LACQVFGRFIKVYIKMEWIFNVVGVITHLRQSRLRIENLCHLIFIINNSMMSMLSAMDPLSLKTCNMWSNSMWPKNTRNWLRNKIFFKEDSSFYFK